MRGKKKQRKEEKNSVEKNITEKKLKNAQMNINVMANEGERREGKKI